VARRWRGLALAGAVLAVPVVWVAPDVGTTLVVNRSVASPDAIVSLSSHEWERLPATIQLARRNARARVVLTLPAQINEFNCHDCNHRVAQLVAHGVAEDRIVVLPLAIGGTYGEANAARDFARREHLRTLLVVTSPYHTRRALATFDKVFDQTGITIGIEATSSTSSARPDAWWWTSYDRWYVRYEWEALLYYRVRYGVGAFPGRAGARGATLR